MKAGYSQPKAIHVRRLKKHAEIPLWSGRIRKLHAEGDEYESWGEKIPQREKKEGNQRDRSGKQHKREKRIYTNKGAPHNGKKKTKREKVPRDKLNGKKKKKKTRLSKTLIPPPNREVSSQKILSVILPYTSGKRRRKRGGLHRRRRKKEKAPI